MRPGSVYGQAPLNTFVVILLTVSKSIPLIINLKSAFYHRLATVNSKNKKGKIIPLKGTAWAVITDDPLGENSDPAFLS